MTSTNNKTWNEMIETLVDRYRRINDVSYSKANDKVHHDLYRLHWVGSNPLKNNYFQNPIVNCAGTTNCGHCCPCFAEESFTSASGKLKRYKSTLAQNKMVNEDSVLSYIHFRGEFTRMVPATILKGIEIVQEKFTCVNLRQSDLLLKNLVLDWWCQPGACRDRETIGIQIDGEIARIFAIGLAVRRKQIFEADMMALQIYEESDAQTTAIEIYNTENLDCTTELRDGWSSLLTEESLPQGEIIVRYIHYHPQVMNRSINPAIRDGVKRLFKDYSIRHQSSYKFQPADEALRLKIMRSCYKFESYGGESDYPYHWVGEHIARIAVAYHRSVVTNGDIWALHRNFSQAEVECFFKEAVPGHTWIASEWTPPPVIDDKSDNKVLKYVLKNPTIFKTPLNKSFVLGCIEMIKAVTPDDMATRIAQTYKTTLDFVKHDINCLSFIGIFAVIESDKQLNEQLLEMLTSMGTDVRVDLCYRAMLNFSAVKRADLARLMEMAINIQKPVNESSKQQLDFSGLVPERGEYVLRDILQNPSYYMAKNRELFLIGAASIAKQHRANATPKPVIVTPVNTKMAHLTLLCKVVHQLEQLRKDDEALMAAICKFMVTQLDLKDVSYTPSNFVGDLGRVSFETLTEIGDLLTVVNKV